MTHHHPSRLEQSPCVKICAPYIDGDYSCPDFVPCDGYNDLRVSSFSHWMNAGPLFTEPDIFDWGYGEQCPLSFTSPPSNGTSTCYNEPLDSDLFSWPSPQPRFSEYTNAFTFDFATSLPNEFPSMSLHPDHLPSTPSPEPFSKSQSPTSSCSSLDPLDIKSSPSRDSSPLRTESDQQRQRRRFPCLIIGCERRFTSQYTLKVHMEAHKPKPRSSFPCTLGCAEKFSRQHDRLRHEVAKHGKICEFSCDDCGRFFSTRKTLSNHKCPLAHGGTRWVNN